MDGSGIVSLAVPSLASGRYQIEIAGPGFNDKATVAVEDRTLVFVETDKPIYKPGQIIHVRLITLDTMLKPWPAEVTLEVQDAKGIKVFKKVAATDDYGTATVDMPLSHRAESGRMEGYGDTWRRAPRRWTSEWKSTCFPSTKSRVVTSKSWVLADEPITGTVSAEYTFGKPVTGEVEVVASRYVGPVGGVRDLHQVAGR